MRNKEIEYILERLNYTMQKKTYRLMELRVALNDMPKKFAIPIGVSSIAGVYATISYERYLNYAVTTFKTSSNIFLGIEPKDLGLLLILISGGLSLYFTEVKRKKTKESYDTLRKDIIKSINGGFCNCGKTCNCKDDYIQVMESLGIELVF